MTITEDKLGMTVQKFATIPAIQSKQFGREVFSAVLQFNELRTFLHVFPEVQRSASPRKISKIKSYIASWLDNPEELRFFNALTATTRGAVFYDDATKRVAVDINESKLSINDGQHRITAISSLIDDLKAKEVNARTSGARAKAMKHRLILEEMSITVVIFNQMNEEAESQLFFDLNNLSSRPSRNTNIRLNQNDLWSKISRAVATENDYLVECGVEMNKGIISGKNPNFILMTTLYAVCRNLFSSELRANPDFLTDHNYEDIRKELTKQITQIFDVLPKDLTEPGKYILRRSYAFRGIASFIRESYEDITIKKKDIYQTIKNVNWLDDIDYWQKFGAISSVGGTVSFPNHGADGEAGIKKACQYELQKITE